MMSPLRIVLLCIVAAIFYGIVHDQVTARLCVEYFTIGHRPILNGTHSPTLLGFGWGIIATWWAGLMIGIPLAVVSQAGRSRRKVSWFELIRPVAVLLAVMTIGAFTAGAAAFKKAEAGAIVLKEPLSWQVPFELQSRFIACSGAHLASYAVGLVGGLVLCGYVGIRRLWSLRGM